MFRGPPPPGFFGGFLLRLYRGILNMVRIIQIAVAPATVVAAVRARPPCPRQVRIDSLFRGPRPPGLFERHHVEIYSGIDMYHVHMCPLHRCDHLDCSYRRGRLLPPVVRASSHCSFRGLPPLVFFLWGHHLELSRHTNNVCILPLAAATTPVLRRRSLSPPLCFQQIRNCRFRGPQPPGCFEGITLKYT